MGAAVLPWAWTTAPRLVIILIVFHGAGAADFSEVQLNELLLSQILLLLFYLKYHCTQVVTITSCFGFYTIKNAFTW